MKNKTYLIFIFIILNSSCGKDNLEDIGNDIVSDVPENTITAPCSFNLSDLTTDSTIKIDCILDLNGQTITLSNNVNFEFGRGDIINGKLIFSNGTIDVGFPKNRTVYNSNLLTLNSNCHNEKQQI
ncbi:hypothetical protein [Cellulophaga baltica]|uniref:Uncharacterized protein n=1 Tax=Cellulophaga baltica TaxID=76594 RepID=A0A1G7LYN5_9FLAO|nr:hypothetical protein [Cellulophaga baltica]SDF54521.1 hypothetical protein SAMN04487992_1242 [Cellulophaga baltica]